MPADPAQEAAAAAAGALLRTPIAAIERVRGFGRNSSVYRIRAGGASYALKQYPPRREGERDRAGVEFGALRFLAAHGIAEVPKALAADSQRGYALLEWIDGDPVTAPTAADIAAAAGFLAAIHALRDAEDARAQPPAAEACLSAAEIVAQIERRLARLDAIAAEEPKLAALLDGAARPLLAQIGAWAIAGYEAAGFTFDHPIEASAQTLCPADFGLHNTLRRKSGQLIFIDFDYFGWDDPVKLTADFLLHPGTLLPEPLKRQFAAAAAAVYQGDAGFRARLAMLYPLFALRWCLILLNEFLPERWANRLNAGIATDRDAAKQRQLDRASEWMHSLAAGFRWFPYGE
jgi:Ser/Thr protein kinase RdoA (MazF antagonist)